MRASPDNRFSDILLVREDLILRKPEKERSAAAELPRSVNLVIQHPCLSAYLVLPKSFNLSYLEIEPHFSKTCSRNRFLLGEIWKKEKVSFKVLVMFPWLQLACARLQHWDLKRDCCNYLHDAIGAILFFLPYTLHASDDMAAVTWSYTYKRDVDVVLSQTWQNSVCYALTRSFVKDEKVTWSLIIEKKAFSFWIFCVTFDRTYAPVILRTSSCTVLEGLVAFTSE